MGMFRRKRVLRSRRRKCKGSEAGTCLPSSGTAEANWPGRMNKHKVVENGRKQQGAGVM